LTGSKERDRRRARDRFEQQRQIQLERRRKLQKRWGIGIAVVVVLGLIGGLTATLVGGSSSKPTASASASPSTTASASPSASASATATTAAVTEPATHCTYSTSGITGTTVKASLPPATPNYKATYTATINTNLGKIDINLLNSKATCTVNSFVHLAQTGFWNSTQCHRVSDSSGLYMLQCGDPTAKASQTLSCSSSTLGSGGPGYQFDDENLTSATYNAGTVAMANGGPNTNGSQFFLVFQNSTLSPSYTPFGTITSGLDILQKVAKAGTSCTFSGAGGGVPKDKVIINSVTIKQS
jgi:peptidyl-prolyl cis-trans isomerase B (cyclophilin B)